MGQNFPPISGSAGGGAREVLTANRTYYINPSSGSDSNDGLSPGAGAFATIQKGVDTVTSLDLSIYDATIQLEDDTYSITDSDRVVLGPYVTGGGVAKLIGNPTTPTNVLLRAEAGFTLTHDSGESMIGVIGQSTWQIGDFAVSNLNSVSGTNLNVGIGIREKSFVQTVGDLVFNGSSASVDMQCIVVQQQSFFLCRDGHTCIFDSSPNTFQLGFVPVDASMVDFSFGAQSGDITFIAGNSFSTAFLFATDCSVLRTLGVTYTGTLSATNRYNANGNCSIQDAGNVPAGATTDTLANGSVRY